MSCNHSQRKDTLSTYTVKPFTVYLSTMLSANVSSNISKKKKPTGELITLYRNYNSLCLNILKDTTTQESHIALLEC